MIINLIKSNNKLLDELENDLKDNIDQLENNREDNNLIDKAVNIIKHVDADILLYNEVGNLCSRKEKKALDVLKNRVAKFKNTYQMLTENLSQNNSKPNKVKSTEDLAIDDNDNDQIDSNMPGLSKKRSLPPAPHSSSGDPSTDQSQSRTKKYKEKNSTTNGSLNQSNSNFEVNMTEDFIPLGSFPLSQQPSSSDNDFNFSFPSASLTSAPFLNLPMTPPPLNLFTKPNDISDQTNSGMSDDNKMEEDKKVEDILTVQLMLTRAGFSNSQLKKIEDSPNGYKKLRALAKLLQPINQSSSRTHLAALIDAGLIKKDSWTEQLTDVVNKKGGSNNLEALYGLFRPLPQEEQSLDGKKILRTPLDVLIDLGFMADKLINVVSHGGGSKNLKALIDLSFKVSGFIRSYQNSADHIAVLANANSRSAHIEFLTNLLLIKECSDFISQSQNLADVCKSIASLSAGAIKDTPISLADLKALLPPAQHSSNSDHSADQSQSRTKKYKRKNSTTSGSLNQSNSNIEVNMIEDFIPLKRLPLSQRSSSSNSSSQTVLTEAGFSDSQLEKIKDSSNGYKKIEGLARLLQPIDQSSSRICLAALIDAGLIKENSWTEQLTDIVSKKGGSKSLNALCNLLKPLPQEERSLVDSQKILRTPLDVLIDLGFMSYKLMNVVNHKGGSGNLKALIDLSFKVSGFIRSYQNSAYHITVLANAQSRSAHIEFLTDVLLIKECSDFVSQNRKLADICKSLACFSAEAIEAFKPISLANLEALLLKKKVLPPVSHFSSSDCNIDQSQSRTKDSSGSASQNISVASDTSLTMPFLNPPMMPPPLNLFLESNDNSDQTNSGMSDENKMEEDKKIEDISAV